MYQDDFNEVCTICIFVISGSESKKYNVKTVPDRTKQSTSPWRIKSKRLSVRTSYTLVKKLMKNIALSGCTLSVLLTLFIRSSKSRVQSLNSNIPLQNRTLIPYPEHNKYRTLLKATNWSRLSKKNSLLPRSRLLNQNGIFSM